MTLVLASVRSSAADFVQALIWVYTLMIIAYILTGLVFAAGLRIPYSRWSDAVLTFLRDVCEPYLRVFRRVLPSVGGLDFSPIVGILLLQIVGTLIVRALH